MLGSALKQGADQYQDVHGVTFECLLASFDKMIIQLLDRLSHPLKGIVDSSFVDWCRWLADPRVLRDRRERALQDITESLQMLYNQRVVILIDEYDSPMHAAIENGYAQMVPH